MAKRVPAGSGIKYVATIGKKWHLVFDWIDRFEADPLDLSLSLSLPV